MLWFEQQSEGGRKVVVLPWGLEMVRHRQIMHRPAHSPHNKKRLSHLRLLLQHANRFLIAILSACDGLNNIL